MKLGRFSITRLIKSQGFIPAAYVLIGLFYFFEPFLFGWFSIVDPFIAREIFVPLVWMVMIVTLPFMSLPDQWGFYAFDIAFCLITLLYLVYFYRLFQSGWTERQKRLAFLPLVIFPIIWLLMTPLGYSFGGMKRVHSTVIGGWTRIMFAGGTDAIRTDGLRLLDSVNDHPTNGTLPPSEVPRSLGKLGHWVKVDQEQNSVLVGIARTFGMADEFGYIIHDDNKPFSVPDYLRDDEFLRIWKLSEGIYFFEN